MCQLLRLSLLIGSLHGTGILQIEKVFSILFDSQVELLITQVAVGQAPFRRDLKTSKPSTLMPSSCLGFRVSGVVRCLLVFWLLLFPWWDTLECFFMLFAHAPTCPLGHCCGARCTSVRGSSASPETCKRTFPKWEAKSYRALSTCTLHVHSPCAFSMCIGSSPRSSPMIHCCHRAPVAPLESSHDISGCK